MPDGPPTTPEFAIEKAALDLIANFSLAQEEATSGITAYLDSKGVAENVRQLIWRGSRMADDERARAIVVLAGITGYPLHRQAFRDTYSRVKGARDEFAHRGPIQPGVSMETREQFVWTFTPSPETAEGVKLNLRSLADVRSLVADARWLYLVGWRVRSLITGDGVPSPVMFPSDIPGSAVDEQPIDRTGWGQPPLCPLGHANVVGVGTRYGDAWKCGHCERVWLCDESSLTGSRATLTAQDPGDAGASS